MTQKYIHPSAQIYGNSSIGKESVIMENCIIGYPEHNILKEIIEKGVIAEEYDFTGVHIGNNAMIRAGTTIFSNVNAKSRFMTGHNAMIRENTEIGEHVLVGTNTIIDGNCKIGSNVSIQGNVYIPTHVTIEDNVFIGPCSCLTNDRYPVRGEYVPLGPTIREGASIGGNSTIVPGVEIGEGAMVAAGALVTKDVPDWKMAIGCPAKIKDLPGKMKTANRI